MWCTMADIDALATRITAQADRLFPNRTDTSMFLKLYGEIAEMIDANPDNVEGEVADVLIMVLDFARRRGISISTAIQRKMAVNDVRKWETNQLGVAKHVE